MTGHHVRAVPGSQHIRVEIGGRLVAESSRPLLVHETGMPVRYYLPPEDVDFGLLEPTGTHTTCPFKGEASYWSFDGRPDVAWAYPDPIDSVTQIKGHLCFYDTVADITVETAEGAEGL